MIHFLLVKSNSFTIKNYRERQGRPISELINIQLYEEISDLNHQPCHAIIFSDFDRLDSAQFESVKKIAKEIKEKYPALPIYNDPGKVKQRYELLKELYDMGINDYNVYRLHESRKHIRFPVFLREENEHTGALTKLIYDQDQVNQNILYLKLLGYSPKDLLIVEYCDVSNQKGQFHKYSALKFRDKILPKNFDLESGWVVKTGRELKLEDEFFDELEDYMLNNPHHTWLKRIFEIAQIEYGRADYAFLNNRPQLWEINPNPSFGGLSKRETEKLKKRKSPLMEIINRYRKHTLPIHEQLHNEFRQLSTGLPITLELNSCIGINKKMKSNRRRNLKRMVHMWMEAKRTPYREIVGVFQSCVQVLSKILYKIGVR